MPDSGHPPQPTNMPPDSTPSGVLLQMITGYWISQAVIAAAKLGIADLLRDGPRSCEELAEAAGVRSQPLYRLLRALASVGVFREVLWEGEEASGRFGLTPLASQLRSDTPDSQRAFALLQEYQYRPWEEVLHSLRTEETAFEYVFDKPFFPYLAEHPQAASIFNEAMANRTAQATAAVVAAYDFGQFGTLVDVGGGSGLLLTDILLANPTLYGVLFDLPHVTADADQRITGAGLAERCHSVAGDFFQAVPPGGDAYLLKWIIHDWEDERAATILRRCRQAMTPSSKLLVIEAVLPPGNTPFFQKWIDLTMLTITGGSERTKAEYRELFEAAGLRLTRVIPTATEFSIIEGQI